MSDREKIFKGEKYLLHWRSNPFYWNYDIKDIKKLSNIKSDCEEYYTIVVPHFTGTFDIVDCTCDLETGDFYPINTELLQDYDDALDLLE